MVDRFIELSLSHLAVEAAAEIESLRLLSVAGAPQLVTSATAAAGGRSTRFATMPLHPGGSASLVAVIPQLLAVPPRWDVASDGRGGSAIVYEVAGGAMNALSLARAPGGDPPTRLTERHPLESFGDPRFCKNPGGAGDLAFSAIVDSARAVAFAGAPGGAYTPLFEAKDALLVRWDPGYVLFYTTTRPGPVRGSDLARGVLRCVRLGGDLRPMTPALAPLGDDVVFEIDVDVLGVDLGVVATTEAGVTLALLRVGADAVEVVARRSVPHEAELVRPAIVAAGGALHVAVLRLAASDPARLWAGAVEIRVQP